MHKLIKVYLCLCYTCMPQTDLTNTSTRVFLSRNFIQELQRSKWATELTTSLRYDKLRHEVLINLSKSPAGKWLSWNLNYGLNHSYYFVASKLGVWLCDSMDCSLPCSSAHRFSRQKYYNQLLFPSPGIFPIREPLYRCKNEYLRHTWPWSWILLTCSCLALHPSLVSLWCVTLGLTRSCPQPVEQMSVLGLSTGVSGDSD